MRELRDLLAERGVPTSTSALSRFFVRPAITRKKGALHAAEQERLDLRAARLAWFKAQLDLDPERLVFVDETAAAANMVRRYARALPSALQPELNPIEQLFANLKALLRSAAAQTVPKLWAAIREAFTRFKHAECRNYIAASGHDAYDPA